MRRASGLRLRLTIAAALLSGGVLLLLALGLSLALSSYLLSTTDARLQARAAELAATLAAASDAERAARLEALAPLLAADGVVALLMADGAVQASAPGAPPLDLAPLAAQARQGEPVTGVGQGGERFRLLASPLAQDDPTGPMLLVAQPLAALDRATTMARLLLLLGGAIAAALITGGMALLLRRGLAPLNSLMQGAAAIASTANYHQRLPAPEGASELAELAATLNQLIMTVERTLEQQRAFLADTSHELRSPLTVVLANLHLLRRNLTADERELSVAEATAEAQRMRRLINELLLLAQSDAAQVIAQAPVRLDELVAEAVDAVQRLAPGHHYRVEASEPLVVIGDEERLTQLVRNLLENAAAHTPPGTTVAVRLRRCDKSAQLTVADNGPGIAAAHLPRLWDRYYRVDKVRSRSSGGTGLGLPIVKYIAEAHNGQVAVESVEGEGSTFTVELPLAPEAAWS